ncbi:MAG: hypothetical protein LBV30_09515, partial [Propionibacteriaceae bacterium]|nr:hypothetical protein [Propionibacteriaceae bacterium]
MTTTAVGATVTARRSGGQLAPLAHLGAELRFQLRYNRTRLIVWFLVTAGMIGFIGAYYATLDPDALQVLIQTGGTDAMKSLLGWTAAAVAGSAPLGAAVWIKGWMFVSLMLGIGMVFLMTHNLRADEDAGRTELFRSRPLGLHASLAAALIMAIALCLLVGIGIGLFGQGLHFGALLDSNHTSDPDPLGSWVFAASITAIGLIGVGLGAVTNQLMASSAGANGLGTAIIGVFYLLRMGTDVANPQLTWISPIGWAEQMNPWADNHLWPMLLVVALLVVLVVLAWQLEARRDFAGSLFAARPGHRDAAGWMTGVVGLAIRLQRTAWISWAVGIAVFALMLGSITPMMADMFDDVPFVGVDAASILSVVGLLLAMISLGVSSFAIYSAATMAQDDTRGLLERQLAGAVSRLGWAGKRIALAFVAALILLVVLAAIYALAFGAGMKDYSDTGVIIATAFAFIPSLLVLIGVVVLGVGCWPRLAVAISWGAFGALWFIMILGEALRLPEQLLTSLPFFAVATMP